MSKFGNWFRSLQTRSSLAILVTAAVLIEVTGAVQYWFAAKGIREEARHRAEAELQLNSQHIQGVMTAVEVAVANTIWAVEANLNQPDSIYSVLRHIVLQNPTIVGCGTAFIADYYPERGRWFEPYVAERDNGHIEMSQIGSADHDYLNAQWYQTGMAAERGYWSEPYYDEAGARMMLCTYTMPICDHEGRAVALLGADVSLDWLGSIINAHPIYPSSYNLMISREGQIMACPVESLVMRRTIYDVTSGMKDTTANRINQQMLAGKSGHTTIRENDGTKNYVFFAPVEGKTGWSMAVVCSDDEIYRSLRTVGFNLFVLMIVGLILMGYLISRTIRGFNHLQEINAEKERMGSELRIASGIQMGMIPKTFPPFPDRDDVEVYASLLPAKEVGGDLYDFFIRDEKLFFCVGDVSGKGVPASLVMAVTRSLFRSVSAHEANPGRIVENMNSAMTEMNDSNMFVTLFVGVLDLPTGRFHYCNAGHCPPLLIGAGVGTLPVDSNIPLGLMGDWKYTAQESIVSPQTTIFLYTDGLTEAENGSHKQFGEKRMMDVARRTQGDTLNSMVSQMSQSILQFEAGAEQSDDQTILVIRYTKEKLEERLSRSITLPNDVSTIPSLASFVEEVAGAVGYNASTTMSLNLAVEEAVVNVMNYAFPRGTIGNVNIEACANDVRLKFIITDNGQPFDPTAVKDADVSLSAEERPVGGLGIYLVRKLMDSINYESVDGHNVLTLRKKLNPIKDNEK